MADDNDDFAKMFDDLAKLGDEPAPLVPVEEPAPVVLSDAPAETPAETPVEAAVEEAVEPEPEPDLEPASTPAPSNEDLLARFAQIVREQPAPAAPQPAASPPAPAAAPQLFSAAELKELETYEKDWPDVAKAEGLRRRAEYHQLLNYVFEQVSQRIAPLEQMTVGGAERSHLNDLYSLIPDYDQVRDPVLSWVEQQPGYLKAAYQQVARQGTPSEIADLVGRYKQAAGAAPPAATPVAPITPAPQVRKAAAALAPVKSARSGAVDSQPEDFDGAFAAFSKAL